MKKVFLVLLIITMTFTFVFATGQEESKVIKVWYGWPGLAEIFDAAKVDYEAEHPDVTLELTAMNLRDFEQKLAVSLPSGTGPDVFITSEYIIPQYINADLIAVPPESVNSFVEENFDELVKKVNLFKGPEDQEARLYGVPHIGIARVQYFNKDIMEEEGLDPVAPLTWEEQLAEAQKMTKYDDEGNIIRSGMSLRIYGGGSGIGEKFMIKLVQAGGSFMGKCADGGWKASYNSEAGVDALNYYLSALYTYKCDSIEAKHDTDAFINGLTCFYDRELFPVPMIHETAPNLNFGTAPMPGKVNRGTVYSTESYFVPKACKNKDTAWDFIIFMQKEKYVKEFFEEQGWVAPRTDIDFSDIFEKYPEYKAALEFPEGYKLWIYPALPQSDEIITKFAEHLTEAFKDESLCNDRVAIKALLDSFAEETNSILNEYGILGEGPVVDFVDVVEAPKDMGYSF